MKIRSDFVSNSSSSSFVVKAEKDTPAIFAAGEKYSFKDYTEKFLKRDLFECFSDFVWFNRSEENIETVIKIIPNDTFVSEYIGGGVSDYVLPEICREYVRPIIEHIENIMDISAEPRPDFFENGKISETLDNKLYRARMDRKYDEIDKLDRLYAKACKKITSILSDHMKKWNFYYVELEDNSVDEESAGYNAVNDVNWYRIFSNH